METFTLDEANILVEYYSDKIIGKQIVKNTLSKIIYLEKKMALNKRYWINCYGTKIEIIEPFRSITKVALYLNLLSQNEVLNQLLNNEKNI